MNRDLTVGRPEGVLWRFCLPLLGSVLFQQLYNIADSLVAGKFIGENALAAVGNSYEITLIFLAFAFGCNMGCSVVVAQLFGAHDHAGLKTTVTTTLLFTLGLCALLMTAGLLTGGWLLALINTPDAVMADSKLYLDIYIWGLPFVFFYNLATGIFSALGDSKTPFLFLAASSTANIGVDILFVRGLGMAVDGVAWATFLCQGVSCLLSLAVVWRRLRGIHLEERAPLFSWPILKRVLSIALPSTAQQSFVSVGNIVLQWAINGFGPAVMAGYSAAIKLNNLVITSFATLGNGVSSFTAQNVGAGQPDRVRAGFRAGIKMVWVLCLPLCLLYLVACGSLLGLFMDHPTPLALSTGRAFLRIVSPFYFVISMKIVADGVLRGVGAMRAFVLATSIDLILRVGLALLLARTPLGATGIWCAWPVGWVIATGCSLLFYRRAPLTPAR